jgi:hypothetical protein
VLSQATIAEISTAFAAAEEEVRRLADVAERADSSRVPGWSWVVPSDEARAASAAAATLAALRELRDVAIVTGDEEQGVKVASSARELAQPGHVAAAIERPPLASLPFKVLPWWVWGLGGLVVLMLLAPYAQLAAAFASRRRGAA